MPVTLTLEELRQLIGDKQGLSHSFKVGQKYLIRTVTLYYTGLLTSVTDTDFVLSQAAWIADTGRFYDCLKKGTFNEVEPFIQDVIIPRGCIIDATIWEHDLPKEQK